MLVLKVRSRWFGKTCIRDVFFCLWIITMPNILAFFVLQKPKAKSFHFTSLQPAVNKLYACINFRWRNTTKGSQWRCQPFGKQIIEQIWHMCIHILCKAQFKMQISVKKNYAFKKLFPLTTIFEYKHLPRIVLIPHKLRKTIEEIPQSHI